MTAIAAVAILSLAVSIVALRVALRARQDLIEYATALDAGVIAGLRRDHFNLAHNVTDLHRNIGTHPAGASNATNLYDLVQMLSTRIDKHRAEHVAVRDELADHVRAIYLRIGDLERTTGGRDSTAGRGVKLPMRGVKPPTKKRSAK